MISYEYIFFNFIEFDSKISKKKDSQEIMKFSSDFHEDWSWDSFSPRDLDFSGPEAPKKKKKKNL